LEAQPDAYTGEEVEEIHKESRRCFDNKTSPEGSVVSGQLLVFGFGSLVFGLWSLVFGLELVWLYVSVTAT
jgi:hypothetical protein